MCAISTIAVAAIVWAPGTRPATSTTHYGGSSMLKQGPDVRRLKRRGVNGWTARQDSRLFTGGGAVFPARVPFPSKNTARIVIGRSCNTHTHTQDNDHDECFWHD